MQDSLLVPLGRAHGDLVDMRLAFLFHLSSKQFSRVKILYDVFGGEM